MKNAGKACNNRLYRHIRTFEKIVKNYFVICYKYITKGQGRLASGGLALFIADGAQSQGQQFLRLQYGINIAGITLRITKGSIQQRFGNAGRLYAQPACAGQADRPGCRFPRCLWPPRQFQTVRKSPPFPLSPSSQIPP